MKDLANERDAVCEKLRSFNFEPVNAESWLPDGARSWERILEEIRSSDAFLLILGERYGWIPQSGPEGDRDLAVTHLEYRAAREEGLPVLPFQKRLEYDADRESDNAKRRDAFRTEVRDWARGQQVAVFDLASDLAPKAARALVGLLTDAHREQVRARAGAAARSLQHIDERRPPVEEPAAIPIPAELTQAVHERRAVLFAGAGVSLAAGLPSAAVFVEHLRSRLIEIDPEYSVSPSGALFAAVASDVEAAVSRSFLLEQASELLRPPQGVVPTVAHQRAVELFDLIVTTNWDDLFETAADSARTAHEVVYTELLGELLPRSIVHIHGSIRRGDSVILTEPDVLLLDRSRPRIWSKMIDLLRAHPFIFVGTSLRDPSIARLLTEAASEVTSYVIVPRSAQVEAARLAKWNLECIEADAQVFLSRLATEVKLL